MYTSMVRYTALQTQISARTEDYTLPQNNTHNLCSSALKSTDDEL